METEQQQLAAWLEEYALLHDAEEPEDLEGESSTVDFTGEPPLEDGQIRLWPALEGPFYGLVLRSGYGTWKVVPFSSLSLPAIPGEARVRKEAPVQVVEGWNARVVPAVVARQSWYSGRVDSEVGFWLQDWLTVVEQGGEMPERFRAWTGPRLRHPLDPRHSYLQREAERANACLGEPQAEYGTRPQSQAAEESGQYGDPDPQDS